MSEYAIYVEGSDKPVVMVQDKPELLEALLAMQAAFASAVPPMNMQPEWRDAWNATKAAIAKASGGGI